MLNYYGYLVIYQWKSNLVWDAEDFVLLIPDQIFLSLRIKRIFPTMQELQIPLNLKNISFLIHITSSDLCNSTLILIIIIFVVTLLHTYF